MSSLAAIAPPIQSPASSPLEPPTLTGLQRFINNDAQGSNADAGDAGVETDLHLPCVREHSVTASLVGSSVIGAPTYSLLLKCCSDHLTRYHQFFDKKINFSYFIQFRINISVALTLDIYNVLFQLIVELGIDNVSIKFKGRVHRKMRKEASMDETFPKCWRKFLNCLF